jgi:hypothetical protein
MAGATDMAEERVERRLSAILAADIAGVQDRVRGAKSSQGRRPAGCEIANLVMTVTFFWPRFV